MDKQTIIENLGKEQTIENIIKKLTRRPILSPNLQDLSQDLYLDLLEKPEHIIVGLYEHDELIKFIVGMVRNNIFSYSSRFYKEYRKFSLKSENIEDYIYLQKEHEFKND